MIFEKIIIHSFETSSGTRATLRERLKMRKTCGPYIWIPSAPMAGRGFYMSRNGQCGDSTFSLRIVPANDILKSENVRRRLRDIDGYYCDEFQDSTMQPIVARLTHGRGFLIGWTMGVGMCASLEPEIYTDAITAAEQAHEAARIAAEKELEYQIEENEKMIAEENRDKALRRECSKLGIDEVFE